MQKREAKTCALGSNGNVAVSTDNGGSWKVSKPFNTEYWRGVAYGNGKFVAVQSGGGLATVSTSTDGETWTTPIKVGSGVTWMNIAYGNGKFVIVDANSFISSSTDGENWTSPKMVEGKQWKCITYGKFVVADSYRGYVSTSTDGVTWTTAKQVGEVSNNWQGIAAGDGKFIVVGSSGYYSTSTDGDTWSTPTQIKNETGSTVSVYLYGVGAIQ
mgnify:FL=1